MSMMKNRFAETRKAKKEVKTVEFDGLMPWSPETGLMTCNPENEVVDTDNNDDDGLMPWSPETGLMTCNPENEVVDTDNNDDDGLIPWEGTPAQREAADRAFALRFGF